MQDNSRKFFSCFIIVLIIIGVANIAGEDFPWSLFEVQNTHATNDEYKYRIESDAIIITSYIGEDTKIKIPDDIDGIKVKGVDDNAFKDNTKLIQIDFPNSVTEIGSSGFEGCTSLAKIDIGTGVKNIDDNAFSGCTSLDDIDLPTGLEQIGSYAFSGTGIKSIQLPSSVMSIGEYAFLNCYGLTDIQLSGSLNGISNNMFQNCSSLKKIIIPGSVSIISAMAFSNCVSLEEVDLTASVTKIGQYAFEKCISLKEIYLPDSVSEIGEYAYFGCSSASTLRLSESINVIEEGVFENCDSIPEVVLPNKLTKVGENAFAGDKSIKSIELPGQLSEIGDRAFLRCVELTEIKLGDKVVEIGDNAFMECEKLEKVFVGYRVMGIGNMTFSRCSALEYIVFTGYCPKEIGAGAFDLVSNSIKVTVPKGEKVNYLATMNADTGIPSGGTFVESGLNPIEENNTTTPEPTDQPEVQPTDEPDDFTQNEEYVVHYYDSDGNLIKEVNVSDEESYRLEKGSSVQGYLFIGWSLELAGKSYLYPEDASITVTSDMDLKAITIKMKMADGASIRLGKPTGMRFTTKIYNSGYDELTKFAEEIQFGTLICPTETVRNLQEYTLYNLKKSGSSYIDIPVKVWFKEADDYKEFTGVMTNVKEENYNRMFSARAYISVQYSNGSGKMFYSSYSEDNNARNIYQIARAALQDSGTYSDEQCKILQGFVDVVEE